LGVEADWAARDLTSSIASAYRLATSKVTLSYINNNIPGLDRLLKYKRRLRKLGQETRDPACKTAVNWVTKSIRRMTRKKAFDRWETKISNTEVTPQAIWPIALFADDTSLYVTDRKAGFVLKHSSKDSAQWRPGVSAGISKLMTILLGGSTSLVVVDRLSLTPH
jgi:hypothetical protein